MQSSVVSGDAAALDEARHWSARHREYREFVAAAPSLYDSMVNFGLTWPSLTVQWMHDEQTRADATGAGATTQSHLLIGTHTSGNFPNSVQLARVRLAEPGADPTQEFLSHPLAAPLRQSAAAAAAAAESSPPPTAAAPTRRTARSTAGVHTTHPAAAAAADARKRAVATAAASPPLADDPLAAAYSPRVTCYSSPSIDIIGRLRTAHELHRIRPILLQSSFEQNLSASSLVQAAHESDIKQEREENTDVNMVDPVESSFSATGAVPAPTASPSAPAPLHSSFYTRGLFATKGPDCEVRIYDIGKARRSHGADEDTASTRKRVNGSPAKKDTQRDAAPLLTLIGQSGGGWPLDWSCNPAATPGLVLSGDNDGSICVWNLDDAQTGAAAPVASSRYNYDALLSARSSWVGAHDGVINDISWSKCGGVDAFFSVGDDCCLKQWDARSPDVVHTVRAHDDQVSSVSTAPHREYQLLTGGKDRTIRLWDTRNMTSGIPLHTFVGHGDEVLQVTWAPFKHHDGSVFASSSADRRIFIWDCSLIDSPISSSDLDESGPPELLFVHAGHSERVEDFSWHPTRDWVMASVGEENVVQVWEMNAALHQPMDEKERGVFDAVERLIQQSHEVADRHPRIPFDIERVMQMMQTEIQSAVITAPTSTPLHVSNHLSPIGNFVRSYAETIDARLTAHAAVLPTMDSSEDAFDSSSASVTSSTESRSGSVSPPRKKSRVQVQVKMKSAASIAKREARRTAAVDAAAHDDDDTHMQRDPHSVASQTMVSTSTLRSLRHWNTLRKSATPSTPIWHQANDEFEIALSEVLAYAPTSAPASVAASIASSGGASSAVSSSASSSVGGATDDDSSPLCDTSGDESDTSLSSEDEYLIPRTGGITTKVTSTGPSRGERYAKRASFASHHVADDTPRANHFDSQPQGATSRDESDRTQTPTMHRHQPDKSTMAQEHVDSSLPTILEVSHPVNSPSPTSSDAAPPATAAAAATAAIVQPTDVSSPH